MIENAQFQRSLKIKKKLLFIEISYSKQFRCWIEYELHFQVYSWKSKANFMKVMCKVSKKLYEKNYEENCYMI